MEAKNSLFMYFVLVGPIMSMSSSNWVLCWAGMEVGFLGLIPLLLLADLSSSKESALKYFCVQALASALLFLSGSLLFLFQWGLPLICIMFFLALSVKLGLFPGHFWVTGVVFGLSWTSCCLILGPLKLPPLCFLQIIPEMAPSVTGALMMTALVSALIGAWLGNNQTNVRAMIGASSITHSGWLVVACFCGGVWLYLSLYLSVLFLTLLLLWRREWAPSALGVISMSGLPPFIMFVGKFVVIMNMMQEPPFLLLLIPLLLSSALSLIFYLKFSFSFYLSQVSKQTSFGVSSLMVLNLIGAAWLLLFFGGRASQ
uniref:NADH-ubiquinone oxidoreductase chain 2 n=1 Tax=Ovatella vulcani TaxID=999270 RepID=G8HPA8_9EUPU|nr:NADH dehydrogenase subunit 2 [Ovatella vulcani]AEQ93847.1 NADH dehydrogenase subunit 2 [Ovatella vulcani]